MEPWPARFCFVEETGAILKSAALFLADKTEGISGIAVIS
jgi:hypothetical protein